MKRTVRRRLGCVGVLVMTATLVAATAALGATRTARPDRFAFSPGTPLPGSPPKGTARGGEPSPSFDPTGNGWVYITTPDPRATTPRSSRTRTAGWGRG